jgi:hypothetical protein
MDEYCCQHTMIRDTIIRCVSFWQQSNQSPENDVHVDSSPLESGILTNKESNKSPVVTAENQDTVPSFLIQVADYNEENTSSSSYTTIRGFWYKLPTDMAFEIVTIRHCDTVTKDGSQTRAVVVQVKTMNNYQPHSYMAGYIVLLLDRASQWRCISASFAVVTTGLYL